MTELETVLDAFRKATACEAALWMLEEGGGPLRIEAGVAPAAAGEGWVPPLGSGPPKRVESPGGAVLVATIAGPRRAWLSIGPCAAGDAPLESYCQFLLPVVAQYLQSALEVEHAANELAERYEEINLLYTISEILGRTVSLQETAATILKEISETVGARRGSILVHDAGQNALLAVAAIGVDAATMPPISTRDPCSVSAAVFRDQRAMIVDDDAPGCDAETAFRRGTMLSVPIMWTAPTGGAEPLGVVNLSERRSGQPFTAGDQKLITAIATQIGTAIQNARLVRASIDQQRLMHEMELAHDLQMRLLPRAELVAPDATVAARVVPAESVGGDFYNLFRLGGGRTGVMIGDVMSHGYRAALIMALTMSASAIHAQTSKDPAEALGALLATLREELLATEMFISSFYAVIDPAAGHLHYANTGHPFAFVLSSDGGVERLRSLDPPLGMVDHAPSAASTPWRRDSDLLLLFTDGVSDARDAAGARLGERPIVDIVQRTRHEAPAEILRHVMDLLAEHTGGAVQRDDLTLVLLRS